MSKSKPGFIRRFFGGIGRGFRWIRNTILNVIFFLIVIVIVVSLIPQDPPTLKKNTAMVIRPSGYLVDQYSYIDPLAQAMEQSTQQDAETRVRDLVVAIRRAADDLRIKALVLELSPLLGGGLSKLEEIGAALDEFKASGKKIYAYSSNYTQAQYFLAAYADEVHINPMGSLLLSGFASYRNYYKSALDKLKINVHIFRVGTYKDAIEPFLRDDMSDASREHKQALLDEFWNVYTTHVEGKRGLPQGGLTELINQIDLALVDADGDMAQLAKGRGLVDHLTTRQSWLAQMREHFGRKKRSSQYRSVNHLDYLALTESKQPKPRDQIGLLVASGTIMGGDQPAGSIGDVSFLKQLERIRNNPRIKALVVRIDSGGGSAVASEEIRLGLETLRQEGIPVVVSMGSVAASGGYWMAMAADEVWASPTTITGSIGVFGMMPTLENSLDHLGIHTDGVGTTQLAGGLRLDRAINPKTKAVMQSGVDNIYQRFLELVANARDSSPEKVNTIAQGRVWTGNAALQLGLVDNLGHLDDAIAAAAKRAELEKFEVKLLEEPLTPLETLLVELSKNQAVSHYVWQPLGAMLKQSSGLNELSLIKQTLRPASDLLQLLKTPDTHGVYASCLECEIKL